jgi:phospholipid/cholesterol/gamma-HCH transport system substrate-binding protein
MSLPKGGVLRAGTAFLVITVLIIALAISINGNFGLPFNLSLSPPGQDYNLKASFKDANGLIRGADVVVAGHSIGQVVNVAVGRDESVASMRIGRNYAPIHRGTIARIRYSTLLAQKYIELSPVAGPEDLPGGSTIPSSETITPVDFDQFLSAFDPDTRSHIQDLVRELGGGVDARAAVINDLLDQLHGLSAESRPGLQVFASHDPNIDHIVTNLAVTSVRLRQSRTQLGDLIQQLDDVNTTLADENGNLIKFFIHLANTMDDFDATLNGNESTLHTTITQLDPLIVQLDTTLGIVNPQLDHSLAAFPHSFSRLAPEMNDSVRLTDANGNYLRQFLVVIPGCDSIQSTPQPDCTGGNPPQGQSAPTHDAKPAPGHAPTGGGAPSGAGAPGSGGPPPGGSRPGGTGSPPPTTPAPAPTSSCDPISRITGRC